MKILLLGPYWGNAQHGAEPGIYDALVELGHEVSVWDYRVSRFRFGEGERDLVNIGVDAFNGDVISDIEDCDITLCPGAGLQPPILESKPFTATKGSLRILWNSEPIRLGNYRGRVENNRKHFQMFCTFDESEIPLYKEIGIKAQFLPQAFNPKWYRPLKLQRNQRFPGHLCFIASFGPKWKHRVHLLQRLHAGGIPVHNTTIFNAEKVNTAYNMHDGVLNLGLWTPECGPVENLRAFGLQQRIFESIGAGRVCVTNEIPDGTNQLFEGGKHVLYYSKDNVETVCQMALDKKYRDSMTQEILRIRDDHTYKARMKTLISMVEW